MSRYDEKHFDWVKRMEAFGDIMPWLSFPRGWKIRMITPFGGAAARFCVKAGKGDVSVYADFDGSLGSWSGPYWEIHPYKNGVGRCGIEDVPRLVAMITQSLRSQNRGRK